MVGEPASVQSLNPLNLDSVDVKVLDASASGIAVQIKHHIAAQTEVKVRWADRILFGEVSYCIPQGDGFRAGIRIKETIPLARRKETN